MKQVRLVMAGAALAATATLGMVLPASAARPAAPSPAAAVAAPALCAVGLPNFGVLAVAKAVATVRIQLRTTCALKAPLTLNVTAVGGNRTLGTVVWQGANGVVGNKAVGVFHVVARNYQPGHGYAIPAQRVPAADGSRSYTTTANRFRVAALGRTAFTSTTVDRATKTLHTTGQETVFDFRTLRVIKRGGPTLGYYREGTSGAYRRDTADPKIKNLSGGRVSWVVAARCGTWQYKMVQPATKALLPVTTNYAYTSRIC